MFWKPEKENEILINFWRFELKGIRNQGNGIVLLGSTENICCYSTHLKGQNILVGQPSFAWDFYCQLCLFVFLSLSLPSISMSLPSIFLYLPSISLSFYWSHLSLYLFPLSLLSIFLSLLSISVSLSLPPLSFKIRNFLLQIQIW